MRKNKKNLNTSSADQAKTEAQGPIKAIPTEAEYEAYIKTAEKNLDDELKALKIAAKNLSHSSKKIARVKGVYSSKLSRRKKRKYGVKLANYNESLDTYISIISRVNWLIGTLSSCYEGLATVTPKVEKARKIRIAKDKYIAKITYKKNKIEQLIDGTAMPVSSYVK